MNKRQSLRFDKVFPVLISSEQFGECNAMARNISAGGILLAVVVGRQRRKQVKAVDLAAAASAVTHTIPTEPLPAAD